MVDECLTTCVASRATIERDRGDDERCTGQQTVKQIGKGTPHTLREA